VKPDQQVKVGRLYKLLVDKKNVIDCVIESQPVYVIAQPPKYYSFPCITCWMTSCLELSILE
jgi:hypothetical protein